MQVGLQSISPERVPAALLLAVDTAVPGLTSQDALQRARAFAEPLIAHESLVSGENVLAHADAVAQILANLGAPKSLQAGVYLVYACPHLSRPHEVLAKAFGESHADLAMNTNRLMRVQRQAAQSLGTSVAKGAVHKEDKWQADQSRTENVRKMLLAFSRDLRVLLLRLASRLQTLRWYAHNKQQTDLELAHESLNVFASLANRLGIWQIKWELEDLAFRALEPQTYKEVARHLDEKRIEREQYLAQLCEQLTQELQKAGISATVQGRPKHIYSIVKKMRGKSLAFNQVFDLRAMRVIVADLEDCYKVLAHLHQRFVPIEGEYDDYIAKPKPNGYQSLHTVVRDAAGRPIEIQIRTQAMHDHAEHGVAAHWAYKEAGAKGYAGVSANSTYDAKIAVLRQLLAWERDFSATQAQPDLLNDRIYVLTPDATVLELPKGATPVDFAYSLHTELGHRCRGAKVDGVLVPLNTPLQNGQTVEVSTIKEGGPSRDWLNPDLGFLVSPRARAKVRAWFNAQVQEQTVAKGREAVEKLLQREGRTALKFEELATDLGFQSADDLFAMVGKDEYSLRTIEAWLHPREAPPSADEHVLLKKSKPTVSKGKNSGVLVVGMDSLLTQLARCCKPAPPDAIGGFVTRGKGVSVHRQDCHDFQHLSHKQPDRVIPVTWGGASRSTAAASGFLYPVDIALLGHDRQGLLRDVSEVFAKEKMNVMAVQISSQGGLKWGAQASTSVGHGDTARMVFTVEVSNASRLTQVLSQITQVPGVISVKRR